MRKKILLLIILFIFSVNQFGNIYFTFPVQFFAVASATPSSDDINQSDHTDDIKENGQDNENQNGVYDKALEEIRTQQQLKLFTYLEGLKSFKIGKSVDEWLENFKRLPNEIIHNPYPLDFFNLLPQQIFPEKIYSTSPFYVVPLDGPLVPNNLVMSVVERSQIDGMSEEKDSFLMDSIQQDIEGLPSEPSGYSEKSYIQNQEYSSSVEQILKSYSKVFELTDDEGEKIISVEKILKFGKKISEVESVLEFPLDEGEELNGESYKVNHDKRYDLLVSHKDRVYHRISLPFKELLPIGNFLFFTLYESSFEKQNRIYFIDFKKAVDLLGNERLPIFSLKLNFEKKGETVSPSDPSLNIHDGEPLHEGNKEFNLKLSKTENHLLVVQVKMEGKVNQEYELHSKEIEKFSYLNQMLFYYTAYNALPDSRTELQTHLEKMKQLIHYLNDYPSTFSSDVFSLPFSIDEVLSIGKDFDLSKLEERIQELKEEVMNWTKKIENLENEGEVKKQIQEFKAKREIFLKEYQHLSNLHQIVKDKGPPPSSYQATLNAFIEYSPGQSNLKLLLNEIDKNIQKLLNYKPKKKKNLTGSLVQFLSQTAGSIFFSTRWLFSKKYRMRHESKTLISGIPTWIKRFLQLSILAGGLTGAIYYYGHDTLTLFGDTFHSASNLHLIDLVAHPFKEYGNRIYQMYIADGLWKKTLLGGGYIVGLIYLICALGIAGIGAYKVTRFGIENFKDKQYKGKSWWKKVSALIKDYAMREKVSFIESQKKELLSGSENGKDKSSGQHFSDLEKVSDIKVKEYKEHLWKALYDILFGRTIAHRNFFRVTTEVWQAFSKFRIIVLGLDHIRHLYFSFGYIPLPKRFRLPVFKIKPISLLFHLIFSKFFSTSFNLEYIAGAKKEEQVRTHLRFPTQMNGAYQKRFEIYLKKIGLLPRESVYLFSKKRFEEEPWKGFKKLIENENILNQEIMKKESQLETELILSSILKFYKLQLSNIEGKGGNETKEFENLLNFVEQSILPNLNDLFISSKIISNFDRRKRNFIYTFFKNLFFPTQNKIIGHYFIDVLENMILRPPKNSSESKWKSGLEAKQLQLKKELEEKDLNGFNLNRKEEKTKKFLLKTKKTIVQLLREYFKELRPLRSLIDEIKSNANERGTLLTEEEQSLIKKEVESILSSFEEGVLKEILKLKINLVTKEKLKRFNIDFQQELLELLKPEIVKGSEENIKQWIEEEFEIYKDKILKDSSHFFKSKFSVFHIIISILKEFHNSPNVDRIRTVLKESNNITSLARINRNGFLHLWIVPPISFLLLTLFYPVINSLSSIPPVYPDMFGPSSFFYYNHFIFGAHFFFFALIERLSDAWAWFQEYENLESANLQTILKQNMTGFKKKPGWKRLNLLLWNYLFNRQNPDQSFGALFRLMTKIIYFNFILNVPLFITGQYLFMGKVDMDLFLIAYFLAPFVLALTVRFEYAQENTLFRYDFDAVLKKLNLSENSNLSELNLEDLKKIVVILSDPKTIEELDDSKTDTRIWYTVFFHPIIHVLEKTEELLAQLPAEVSKTGEVIKDNLFSRALLRNLGLGDTNIKELVSAVGSNLTELISNFLGTIEHFIGIIQEKLSNGTLNFDSLEKEQFADMVNKVGEKIENIKGQLNTLQEGPSFNESEIDRTTETVTVNESAESAELDSSLNKNEIDKTTETVAVNKSAESAELDASLNENEIDGATETAEVIELAESDLQGRVEKSTGGRTETVEDSSLEGKETLENENVNPLRCHQIL